MLHTLIFMRGINNVITHGYFKLIFFFSFNKDTHPYLIRMFSFMRLLLAKYYARKVSSCYFILFMMNWFANSNQCY